MELATDLAAFRRRGPEVDVYITDLKCGFRKSYYSQLCAYAIICGTHDAV